MSLQLDMSSLNLGCNSVDIKNSDITEKYEIKWNQVLGSGLNGDVYRCIDKTTSEEYALKFLSNSDSSRMEIHLHGECQSSKHIVGIIDTYYCQLTAPITKQIPVKHYFCVVMEIMKGGDLYDVISRRRKLNEEQAAHFAKQIAIGLCDIHERGVAHRDIKPENILFQSPFQEDAQLNTIKITDFGFAKEQERGLSSPVYTLYYVSPDLLFATNSDLKCKNLSTYDKRCDLWSLGVIIYIMVMGYPPFYPEPGYNQRLTSNMRDCILNGKIMFHNQSEWKSISDNAQDVIKGLLTVDPDRRMSLDSLLAHPWFN
ncbi:hypothetical protein LOD99_13409 [Oopsacas minuta]|uniref:Protein kinase domain-containing protein n=1 Tax=Oopsacas minuta TaxID=111878 RepID=A0AAV7KJC9_9METZ|nr:hypothetical protein LOD99_13409 [Oopsacas minuta]